MRKKKARWVNVYIGHRRFTMRRVFWREMNALGKVLNILGAAMLLGFLALVGLNDQGKGVPALLFPASLVGSGVLMILARRCKQ